MMQIVKTVGTSGQVSLGKEYAGRLVLIDQVEPGVWILKLGEFVPDNERWMAQEGVKQDIDRAVAWAEKNPPEGTSASSTGGSGAAAAEMAVYTEASKSNECVSCGAGMARCAVRTERSRKGNCQQLMTTRQYKLVA